MKKQSLAIRAIVASTIWISIALSLGGYIILGSFNASITRQFDNRLIAQLDLLTAGAVKEEDELSAIMTEPAFGRVYSGWYWQAQLDDDDLIKSRSLWVDNLPWPELSGEIASFTVSGPDNQSVRLVGRLLNLENGTWQLAIMADQSEIQIEFQLFRYNLIISGIVFGCILILSSIILLRFVLSPLAQLRKAVAERYAQTKDQINGDFPLEVAPLVEDLNAMMAANERLREKGRIQAANLAHSLKTPAAILRNEINNLQNGDTADLPLIERAIDKIASETDLHLASSNSGIREHAPGALQDVVPITNDCVSAMRRLFPDKQFHCSSPDQLLLPIDENDMFELLGNLMENAGKWATQEIRLSWQTTDKIKLVIEDDGLGVLKADQTQILKQGVRLDLTKSGSGLGLTIVHDILARYNFNMSFSQSELSGLKVIISF